MCLLTIPFLLLLAECAKIGYPEGGIKDEYPPVVVEADPENYSLHFDRKRIEIEFDEFIQLKNVNQELVVSPPLNEKPIVRLRNKTLVIDLDSALHPNTTYTFNFGQAIADNNEGNLLENYEYVFSTGDYLDSLSVAGSLSTAFSRKLTEEPVMVLLYENLNDSAPYLELPTYVGKSNKKGIFMVNNLKADTFKVFALKDANNNFLYDMAEEEIAFLDSLLILNPSRFEEYKDTGQGSILIPVPDTSLKAELTADSLISDSARLLSLNPYTVLIDLFLFQEDNKPQYLVESIRPMPNKIRLIFNRPLKNEVQLHPLNFSADKPWFIREDFINKDTVDYWITDSVIYKKDTLRIIFTYEVTDSVMNYDYRTDTFRFVSESPQTDKRRTREKEVQKTPGLQVNTSIKPRGTQHIYLGISLEPVSVVSSVDAHKISLSYLIDTLVYKQNFVLRKDTFHLRKYFIEAEWQEDQSYSLFMEPGLFTDYYGLTNDTIQIPFRTQSSEFYGRIVASFSNVESPLIIQLLTEKEALVREQYLTKDGSVPFNFLEPASYLMKIIYDKSDNRKWDTGDYLAKRQPEKVAYYSGSIEVRANWDKEVIWVLKK